MKAEHAKVAWEIYGAPEPAVLSLCWRRPCVDDVVHLLGSWCNYSKKKVLRNLLPALLRWDLTHPEEANIVPMSVVGLCNKNRPVFE